MPREHRAALDGLYNDPLLLARPPGVGELLGEDLSTECYEGEPPTGGRSWVLLDDGADAVAFYKDLGEQSGWTLIEESSPGPLPSRDDTSAVQQFERGAVLRLEKTINDYAFSVVVSVGGSILHEHIGLGVHGRIDSPDVCH